MKYLLILAMLSLTACGYSSLDNEMIGQIKKIVKQNPILCDTRTDVDISLGVMRNGVGSMSSQDIWVTVPNEADREMFIAANESGQLVKIKYNVKRKTWCWKDHIVTGVSLVK